MSSKVSIPSLFNMQNLPLLYFQHLDFMLLCSYTQHFFKKSVFAAPFCRCFTISFLFLPPFPLLRQITLHAGAWSSEHVVVVKQIFHQYSSQQRINWQILAVWNGPIFLKNTEPIEWLGLKQFVKWNEKEQRIILKHALLLLELILNIMCW